MKLLDSKCLESNVVELKFVDCIDSSLKFNVGESIGFFEDTSSYYIKQADSFCEVDFTHAGLKQAVDHSSSGTVTAVVCYQNINAVAIRFIYLNGKYEQPLELILDDLQVENIAKLSGESKSFSNARAWFQEEFFFTNEDNQVSVLLESNSSKKQQRISIIGAYYRAVMDKISNTWLVTLISPLDGLFGSVIQYNGEHKLIDDLAERSANKPEYNAILEQHTKEYGSYFQLWQQYSETYWKQHAEVARGTGYLKYIQTTPCSTEVIKYKFKIGENKLESFVDNYKSELEKLGDSFLTANLELQVGKDIPDWLNENEGSTSDINSQNPLILSNVKLTKDAIIATLSKRPPDNGYLFISLNGVKKQYERQQRAFDLLRQGNNSLPQLRSIFEGLNPPTIGRRKTIRPMTSSLRKTLGDKKLNKGQEKALKIALNTPDIALIIGPPGTGKTQVISAIQQRIAEEGDKVGAPIQYQTLLSSYQHDAVDNVVARSGVFGLPAIKVGGRQKNSNGMSNVGVKAWIAERTNKLMPELDAAINDSEELSALGLFANQCIRAKISNEPMKTKDCLTKANSQLSILVNEYGLNLSKEYLDAFQTLSDRYQDIGGINLLETDKSTLRKAVWGLRTESISFEDDGEYRLEQLSKELKIHSSTARYLEQLTELRKTASKPEQFCDFKEILLISLQGGYLPPDSRCMSNQECKVADKVIDELEKAISSIPRLGQLYFRRKYIQSLSGSERRVTKAITDYVSVIGATCQQAAGDSMTSIKQVQHSNEITFGSVIVDEAARANPLDLMIPMSMAEKRVVLVGDHRQLPHMLEPRVEKELQDNNEIEITQSELLKQSLFERLYRTLKDFEQESGEKRVAMLDTQYRMHPLLGSFVSREFYEAFDLPPIESGLKEDCFDNDIPGYENKVAAWIDIPESAGKMASKAGSKYREVEAERIANEALGLLHSRPDLSVGIITFYAAQRDLIQEKMVNLGVLSNTSEGFIPNAGFDVLTNGEERFRVGTVDAFQGKEFDVVLLSPVRSWSKPAEMNVDSVNKKLGFLRIPNRINVAMSRQKSLLIVVGDKSLASPELEQALSSDADEKVLVGFPAFLNQMCEKEHGLVL